MNRSFVYKVLACGAMLSVALVSPAFAEDEQPDPPPMAIWPSDFRTLDELAAESGQTINNLSLKNASGAANGTAGFVNRVPLPFGFSHLGSEPYTSFNVGARGYMTFGNGNDAFHEGANYLLYANFPFSVIATWWGGHHCDPSNGVRTLVLGTQPHRRFIVEWSNCSKASGTNGTGRTFQTQAWLFEGSNVIRVHYGSLVQDPEVSDWTYVSWGVKGSQGRGWLGPNRDGITPSCDPVNPKDGLPTCKSEHFPAQSVIQYGLGVEPDLTARLKPRDLRVTPTEIELDLDIAMLNVGAASVGGASYEVYLALPKDIDPDQTGPTVQLYTSPAIEPIAGGGTLQINETIRAPRPANGIYRVCLMIDPGDKLSAELDRTNNRVCAYDDMSISVGPDLTVASISAPDNGKPKQVVTVPVEIRNIGNDVAGPFDFRLNMIPDPNSTAFRENGILVGTVNDSLAPGESILLQLAVELPEIMRAPKYTFEIELDPAGLLNEANRGNNVRESTKEMMSHLPELRITTAAPNDPKVILPDGCFYGEEIQATFTVCNAGQAEAQGFHPGIIMGDSSQVGLSDDVTAASFPSFCGSPGTWNYTPCGTVGSLPGICAYEYCRAECQNDTQCGPGLICAEDEFLSDFLGRPAKGCMTYLHYGNVPNDQRCHTYTMKGRIPMQDQGGTTYTDAQMFFHIVDDVRHSLSVESPHQLHQEPLLCRPALLDLAAADVRPGGRFVAGKDISVNRLIRNEGFINFLPGGLTRPDFETFTYRYYIGTTRDVSVNQIPLHIKGAEDGLATATITRKGINVGTDVVSIPPDILPGEYYFALILDPDEELVELDKRNNIYVLPNPILIEPRALTIVNPLLPKANLEAQYSYTFVAMSGLGTYSWTAENLPPGMSLSPTGILMGRPTEAGNFAFTVRVTSGTAVDERVVVLEVLPGLSELQVATTDLPLAVRGLPYGRWYDAVSGTYHEGVKLAASGGQPPYTWELDPFSADGRLPEGLEGPTLEGLITGQPTLMSASSRFTVRVRDALGNENSADLEIVVVDSGTLVVPSRSFPLATSGTSYSGCIEAQGGDGTYHWTVDPDSLPEGLVMEPDGARACLRGIPTVCGNFMVGLQVSDDLAQSSTAAISLSVECGVIQLRAHAVRPVVPGEVVEFQLGAAPSEEPKFRLYRGSLPAGLSLSEDGLISGTVSSDASHRVHDMIIELSDAKGRRSLSALSMSVRIEPPPQELVTKTREKGCGSSTTGDPTAAFSTLGLALLGLGLMRRKHDS